MPFNLVTMALLFEGGLFILAWALGWFLDQPVLERINLRWDAIILGVLATGPLLLGMWWFTALRWAPVRRLMREVEEKIVPAFARSSLSELALICILAGLGEESLFRGVIQTTLTDVFNPWTGLVLTSAVFGIGHLVTPSYGILAGVIGLYLGALSMLHQNLLLVITVHALYDFVALFYLIRKHRRKCKMEIAN